MNKKILTLICVLSLTTSSVYAAKPEELTTEQLMQQIKDMKLVLQYQKLTELMLKKGLAIPKEDGDGVTLSDKGRSYIDQLRYEGKIEILGTGHSAICW